MNQQQQVAVKDQEIAKLTVELGSTTQQLANTETVIRRLREDIRNAQRSLEAARARIVHLTVRDQDAYDLQVSLAARATARRRNPNTRVKRERDDSQDPMPDSSARDPKRPMNIITTAEDGPVDLTGEGNDGNLASSATCL
jgi:septal ring factor EnvC (AmiA/AmiB activator)